MKNLGVILALLIMNFSMSNAQSKVIEKSGKKPNWPFQLEKGFIVGIGNASTLQQAKENAMLNVKSQIVLSVADNITTTSELKKSEVTTNNIAQSFQSYSDRITSKSGKQDYLIGVSQANITDIYWEKLFDKSTKETSYQYFIQYPFTSFDLLKLVQDFMEKDQQLTDELEKCLEKLENFKSIEDIKECQSTLATLYQTFIDHRKSKAKIGIEKCASLLESVVIQNDGSTLGVVRYGLFINNRRVTAASRPLVVSECAIIEDKKIGGETCELIYRFDECYGDSNNKIKVSYSFGNGKTDKLFFFDVTENKADLSLVGAVKFNNGVIEGDFVLNSQCKVELKSKFESPVNVSSVIFEWKEYGVICEIPVNEVLTGKGAHEISFTIPRLPISTISTLAHPENKLNGSIVYSSAKGSQKNKIRIYQKDYITVW